MSTRDEDEAWRAIVENYGERAVIDDGTTETGPSSGERDAPGAPATEPASAEPTSAELDPHAPEPRPGTYRAGAAEPTPGVPPASAPYFGPAPFDATPAGDEAGATSSDTDDERAEARFVPPRPEMPQMSPARWAAWICVLGAPVLFVVSAMVSARVGGWFAGVLALCFLGGFGWLVATMPNEPPDPWDDGSRV